MRFIYKIVLFKINAVYKDRRFRRQGEEGLPLPGDSGGDGQIQELGLAGGGERRGAEPDVDAELVAQSLDAQPLGPGERVIAFMVFTEVHPLQLVFPLYMYKYLILNLYFLPFFSFFIMYEKGVDSALVPGGKLPSVDS